MNRFSFARLGRFALKHYVEQGRRYAALYVVTFGLLLLLRLLADRYPACAVLYGMALMAVVPALVLLVLSRSTAALRDPAQAVIDATLPVAPVERFLFVALNGFFVGFLLPVSWITIERGTGLRGLADAAWIFLQILPILLLVAFRVRRSLLKGYAVVVVVALVVAGAAVWYGMRSPIVVGCGGPLPGLPLRLTVKTTDDLLRGCFVCSSYDLPAALRTAYAAVQAALLYVAACFALAERKIA